MRTTWVEEFLDGFSIRDGELPPVERFYLRKAEGWDREKAEIVREALELHSETDYNRGWEAALLEQGV